ncbi:hypothetical protein O181_124507 [Austropuccinia psidii MF-1]|uniref:eRF1/Pelota-like N-terminal domain-containing protein n=1 Tax=Austropuccinia psidii MF-1 TaxID=1389203 RepID=A0A9Q3KS69_9BASI|nr:hypothetical protein [Austropuccinia psidii MF-1]
MWHVYNLINVGDQVRSASIRKIVTETNSATGAKDSRRIKLNLTIEVKKVLYSGAELLSAESAANDLITPTQSSSNSSNGASLHLSGQISQQNKHVKLGAFHTLDLEPNQEFTIIKGPDGWDSIHMERLSDSLDASKYYPIGQKSTWPNLRSMGRSF